MNLPHYRAARPELDPHHVHDHLMRHAPRELAYREGLELSSWTEQLREAFRSCIGLLPEPVEPAPTWFEPVVKPGYTQTRVEFWVEPHAQAVGWLLEPDLPPGAPKPPVMICLQGHSTGAHLSLGERKYTGEEAWLEPEPDYAVQAVRRGYAAFALEQRGFGERMDGRPLESRTSLASTDPFCNERCRHSAMVALLMGRTFVGERVSDVMRAIDLLDSLGRFDQARMACMGHSGGGTVTYYAACLEPRISAVVLSCSFCTYLRSIGSIDHCSDNYLPGALRWFDTGDLAGLVAPRPMVVSVGRCDDIFPLDGVREAYETAAKVYQAHGAAGRLTLHVGEDGHRFFSESWEVLDSLTGWEMGGSDSERKG